MNNKPNIYKFKGRNLVEKEINGVRYVVDISCNMCGKCCKRAPENWWLGRDKNGWCKYLEPYENDKYICKADIPFGCPSGKLVEWRTGNTVANCLIASWNNYVGSFNSLGWVQIRISKI